MRVCGLNKDGRVGRGRDPPSPGGPPPDAPGRPFTPLPARLPGKLFAGATGEPTAALITFVMATFTEILNRQYQRLCSFYSRTVLGLSDGSANQNRQQKQGSNNLKMKRALATSSWRGLNSVDDTFIRPGRDKLLWINKRLGPPKVEQKLMLLISQQACL